MGGIRDPRYRRPNRPDERRQLLVRVTGVLFVAAALAAIGSFMVDAKIWPFDGQAASTSVASGPLLSGGPTASPVATASVAPTPTPTAAPTPTPQTVTVPALVDEALDSARAMLDSAGLGIKVIEQETTDAQPGRVLTQEPEAGSTAAPGTVVTVRVSVAPPCEGEKTTMIAYGGQTTTGTIEADVIVAVGSGRADIDAGFGDDHICLLGDVGGRVEGGPGVDRIFGSTQRDRLEGGDGDDMIDGGGENDVIYGEDGTTTTVDRGNDTLLGGPGNDLLFGDRGDDLLNGGPGADSLYGADGDDTLEDMDTEDGGDAGDGNDTCLGVGFQKGGLLHCENV